MADKDATAMLSLLTPCAAAWYAVTPDTPRALPAAELAELLAELPPVGCADFPPRGGGLVPVTAASSIEEGVRLAMASAGPDGIVCAVGSLYMSGAVRGMF